METGRFAPSSPFGVSFSLARLSEHLNYTDILWYVNGLLVITVNPIHYWVLNFYNISDKIRTSR